MRSGFVLSLVDEHLPHRRDELGVLLHRLLQPFSARRNRRFSARRNKRGSPRKWDSWRLRQRKRILEQWIIGINERRTTRIAQGQTPRNNGRRSRRGHKHGSHLRREFEPGELGRRHGRRQLESLGLPVCGA